MSCSYTRICFLFFLFVTLKVNSSWYCGFIKQEAGYVYLFLFLLGLKVSSDCVLSFMLHKNVKIVAALCINCTFNMEVIATYREMSHSS